MKLRIINSMDELQNESTNWDSLWQASDVHSPLLRFQFLQCFVQQFHSQDQFKVIVVEDSLDNGDTIWIAGIPLVIQAKFFAQAIAMLPNNPWMICGDLLFDTNYEIDAAMRILSEGVLNLSCCNVTFDWINLERECWGRFVRQLESTNCLFYTSEKFTVGTTRISSSADEFRANLSKNRRKQIKRSLKTLGELGPIELKHVTSEQAESIDEYVDIAFKIESASWKDKSNSSIVSSDLTGFFKGIAKLLTEIDAFEMWLLCVDGQPVAFDLGYRCKQVYTSHKISYDQEYQKHGPGQLLDYLVIEAMSDDPCYEWIDTYGELSEANAKWTNGSYRRSKITLATNGTISRAAFRVFKLARRYKQVLLHRDSSAKPATAILPSVKQAENPIDRTVGSNPGR